MFVHYFKNGTIFENVTDFIQHRRKDPVVHLSVCPNMSHPKLLKKYFDSIADR